MIASWPNDKAKIKSSLIVGLSLISRIKTLSALALLYAAAILDASMHLFGETGSRRLTTSPSFHNAAYSKVDKLHVSISANDEIVFLEIPLIQDIYYATLKFVDNPDGDSLDEELR